ncbi:MAG: PAS domain-containing protein [Anaerolineaceae bacterium]|nr:PAS domain-containing protein [Anaerolineaceae bacterium]
MIINKVGILCYANPAAEKFNHPSFLKTAGNILKSGTVAPGTPVELDFSGRTGEHMAVELRLMEIDWVGQPAYLVIIDDRGEKESGHQIIEKNLNALLGILDDLFFVLNKDGCILHFNPFVHLRLGYTRKELHQHHFYDLCPKRMQEDVRKKLDQIWVEESGILEIALSSKYGAEVPVEIKLTTGEWNAQKVFFCHFSRCVRTYALER